MFKYLIEFLCTYPSSSFRSCFAALELRGTAESLQPFYTFGMSKKIQRVSKGGSITHIYTNLV